MYPAWSVRIAVRAVAVATRVLEPRNGVPRHARHLVDGRARLRARHTGRTDACLRGTRHQPEKSQQRGDAPPTRREVGRERVGRRQDSEVQAGTRSGRLSTGYQRAGYAGDQSRVGRGGGGRGDGFLLSREHRGRLGRLRAHRDGTADNADGRIGQLSGRDGRVGTAPSDCDGQRHALDDRQPRDHDDGQKSARRAARRVEPSEVRGDGVGRSARQRARLAQLPRNAARSGDAENDGCVHLATARPHRTPVGRRGTADADRRRRENPTRLGTEPGRLDLADQGDGSLCESGAGREFASRRPVASAPRNGEDCRYRHGRGARRA